MKSFVFGFELKTFRIYFELYFYYLILFQILDKVLNLSKGVSDKLQSEDLDVVSGCDRVEDLLVAIEELRTEDKSKTFWIATVETCEELNIETPMEKR